jgi:hypothetical protein
VADQAEVIGEREQAADLFSFGHSVVVKQVADCTLDTRRVRRLKPGDQVVLVVGQVRACHRALDQRSHRGRYHTDRHPGDASQYTARCPGTPPAVAATAGPQSQIDQDTVIRPGPHSCPFAQRSG